MSRYIDADGVYQETLKYSNRFRKSIFKIVNALPTADVVEARHAEWQLTHRDKDLYKDVYQCSECRFLVTGTLKMAYAYCPNCGARMDRKE